MPAVASFAFAIHMCGAQVSIPSYEHAIDTVYGFAFGVGFCAKAS